MSTDPSSVEKAVSRALRHNLDKVQRTADELRDAVADLVAACASNRPANALPPMLRAQTAAASLAAMLEVLSRFVTAALQPAQRSPAEQEALRLVSIPAPEPSPTPPPHTPIPMGEMEQSTPPAADAAPPEALQGADMVAEGAPVIPPESAVEEAEPEPPPPQAPAFDLSSLSAEEQELHRRANRVAKVSMQDIKMLRPEDVRRGREHKDLCVRLRDEIEKAHKEYERRFRPILGHPADYFYHWMVEILAGGNPEALGEYPYSSPVLRR